MKKIFCAVFLMTAIFSDSASAAEIESAEYRGDKNLIYPIVIVENPEVAKKINAEICAEIKKFLADVDTAAKDGNFKNKIVEISYTVPCNYEFGILSVILTEYVHFQNSAHPSTFRRALNFNSDSGERILAESLSEIGIDENGDSLYSPKNLTLKLKNYAKQHGIELYENFTELEKLPEDFYFDENLHVNFIFQQYEVAPYAVGIIEFDATPRKNFSEDKREELSTKQDK